MKRFALGISYVGQRYCGYQSQGLDNSVQECVEFAIAKVSNHPIKIMCAGRTDAGVHAMIQVVHFDSDAIRRSDQWLKGINVNLPSDIKALWVKEMDDSFHARFSAISRAYVYVLNPGEEDLFMDPYSWRVGELDVQQMQLAANVLIGEHDFFAFQSRHCQSEHAMRCIHYIYAEAGQF